MPLYKQDPTNPNNQVPVVNNRILVKKARTPDKEIIQKRPDSVIINNTGSYAFLYATTGSIGDNAPNLIAPYAAAGKHPSEGYVTGSVINAAITYQGNITPVKLDINPVAWSRTDASGGTGDVTFVYKGKYVQDGGPK